MLSSPMPSPSVLIVDDEWCNRDLLRIPLEARGYEVAEAENGAQAMEVLQTQSFTLLILDLQMPKLNGLEVLKKVRQMPMHDQMYIAVNTANPVMATDEVQAEADFVLQKPLALQEFLRLIDRLQTQVRVACTSDNSVIG